MPVVTRPGHRLGYRLGVTAALLGASLGAVMLLAPVAAQAQAAAKTKAPKADSAKKKDKADSTKKAPDSPLFRKDDVIDVTLTANYKALRRDKGDKAPWHGATLSYADKDAPDGKRVVPLRVRTRGIWRLKNCDFPPIRFNFVNKDAKGSIFHDLDEPKLVSFCKNTETYEQYVLQEYQLYRIYRLLTPVSHRVRLLKIAYADSATGKVEGTHHGFVVEDPESVALNNNGHILKVKGAGAEDLDPGVATLSYLFQYMIGNTDFSVGGLHNAELIQRNDGVIMPVAYDFDFSGAIDATYATPDPSLPIRRVRERLYRGYCAQNESVPAAVARFVEQKPAIYALYSDAAGALLQPKIVKETLAYFDEFYETITNPKDLDKRIIKDCRKK